MSSHKKQPREIKEVTKRESCYSIQHQVQYYQNAKANDLVHTYKHLLRSCRRNKKREDTIIFCLKNWKEIQLEIIYYYKFENWIDMKYDSIKDDSKVSVNATNIYSVKMMYQGLW